ncbi:helix-turn-helix transcriptional regulator [Sphingomonas lutea]|uniref:Helix-turn-helix transcriptional regulator n=1 Tax=Sphingomonas lutea TaxID=1045317 RepID=A0A7G9SFE5_9SPHN|nr:PadR family transcriptional regulator [Sphingomonas lutea]QNN66570.1 helix-turn-helix transcriptional regulator [Sphingomonas lutea]
MIVLSLIGTGLRYGFEMEEFAQRTNMRRWAKIGMSTIYKALGDLERDGAIRVEIEDSDKGPARKAFTLTAAGRTQMIALIGEALASAKPVYSERIAGLVFAPLMGAERAQKAIMASIEVIEAADVSLGKSAGAPGMDKIGLAVVGYYRAVYAAERVAMERVIEIINEDFSSKP